MDEKCAKIFASSEDAEYDPNTNTILYGINKNMKALGVYNGTCNLINPLMYTNRQKCGLGVASGNPYREHFTMLNDDNFNIYLCIVIILLFLIIS